MRSVAMIPNGSCWVRLKRTHRPPPLPCWWPWCGNVGVGCSPRWVGLFPPVTFDGLGGVAARCGRVPGTSYRDML